MKKRAFTLVETLVTVGIFVGISVIVWAFSEKIFFFNSTLNSSLSVQFSGRAILRKIVAELRNTSPSSLGSYPLALTSTSSIIFYSNIDTDTYKEQIRYFLQNHNLMRGVTKPSGTPLTYNQANEKVDTVAENIINGTSTPIFEYFDENYAGTSSPLSIPINTLSVRLVRITIIVEKDPNRPPPPITITTQVTLRNLKDNL